MVKRISAAIAAMALMLLAAFSAAASEATETEWGNRIWDECGLLNGQEEAAIQQLITAVQTDYQMDCGVLTTRKVPKNRTSSSMDQTTAYADAWYEDNWMGLGGDRAGILYVIDMNNRVSYVSTAGLMIDYINDSRKEELLSSADEDLGRGNYGGAVQKLLKKLQSILARGIKEGHFRYDEVTGQRLTGLYNRLTPGEAVVAGAGGLAASGLVVLGITMRYGLKRKTYKFNKSTQSAVNYTEDEKTFLRQTVSRTRISSGGGGGGGRGGGGGSSVHISSGGMSHGGGGHHF